MKKMLAMGIMLVLMPLSHVLAEPCQADIDCDKKVGLADLVIMKQEYMRTDCDACPPPSPVAKTGQTTCYGLSGEIIDCTGTRHDGDLQKGVVWPNPRFTDNGDGTVTDNLTDLIWLKNANCFGQRTWSQALSDCSGLAAGSCELSDGSIAGDWRLPNRFEMESLLDLEVYDPAISNTAGTGKWSADDPFIDVQSDYYWSSTTNAGNLDHVWTIFIYIGHVDVNNKINIRYVWPVRGP